MFEELEVVELTHDIKENSLKEGDRGTIVEVYRNGKAYEVEFISPDRSTSILLTLMPDDIRSMARNEIFHDRDFSIFTYGTIFNVVGEEALNEQASKISTKSSSNQAKANGLYYQTL